jgi:hypothetical protein
MKSLPHLKTPKVLVDGKPDKDEVVSNVKYEKGTLTFDVKHFSTFKAAPEITIAEPQPRFEVKDSGINLKGTVSDPTASVSAQLNGKRLSGVKVATASGEFSARLDLAEGVNKIIVSALSSNGATSSASVSGTLVLASQSLTSPLSIFLALLGIAAIALVIWTGKMWLKKRKEQKVSVPKVQP